MPSIDLAPARFTCSRTALDVLPVGGVPTGRVAKTEAVMEFDTASYAKLAGCDFHDGTIEVDVLARLLPEHWEEARGFIGVAFRIAEDDSAFECFYVRPTNGRDAPNPVRRQRAMQYFSYPGYDFAYFRDHDIRDYEGPLDIALDEWVHIKAVVRGATAAFHVNGSDEPSMVVEDLKLGADARGSVGIFVDVDTDGYFRNLCVTCDD